MDTNHDQTREKLSIALSLFIALCIIVLFCAISVAISKNISHVGAKGKNNLLILPGTDPETNSRVLL